jgi:hypothetical protein
MPETVVAELVFESLDFVSPQPAIIKQVTRTPNAAIFFILTVNDLAFMGSSDIGRSRKVARAMRYISPSDLARLLEHCLLA